MRSSAESAEAAADVANSNLPGKSRRQRNCGRRTDGRQDRQAGMTSDVGEASGQRAGAGGYRATLISSPIGRNNALLAAAMVVAAP